MIRRLINNINGVTLVEAIIVTTLMAIIMGAGVAPYVIQQDLLKKQFARNKTQDEAAIAMIYITKDLIRAKEHNGTVDASTSTLTITIDQQPISGSAEDTIVYTYDAANDKVSRKVNSGTATVIASYITDLTFTPRANNYVEVSISAEKDSEDITIESGAALRAVRAL